MCAPLCIEVCACMWIGRLRKLRHAVDPAEVMLTSWDRGEKKQAGRWMYFSKYFKSTAYCARLFHFFLFYWRIWIMIFNEMLALRCSEFHRDRSGVKERNQRRSVAHANSQTSFWTQWKSLLDASADAYLPPSRSLENGFVDAWEISDSMISRCLCKFTLSKIVN